MYLFLTVIVVAIFCTMIVIVFVKDNKHDLLIQVGKKFRLSIKIHDEE